MDFSNDISRTAGNSIIPLSRKPSLDNVYDAFKKILS